MSDDLLFVNNKEPFEELLKVDPEGKVYLEGKLVGQSDKLMICLTKYSQTLKSANDGIQKITEALKNFPKG